MKTNKKKFYLPILKEKKISRNGPGPTAFFFLLLLLLLVWYSSSRVDNLYHTLKDNNTIHLCFSYVGNNDGNILRDFFSFSKSNTLADVPVDEIR